MLPIETIITQINKHHSNAMKQAKDAVESAKAAGELLLQVKATQPHGAWTSWLKAHLNVSDRQAQRYMSIAKGKPVPLRKLAGKTDTVSVFAEELFVPLPRHISFAKDVGSKDNHYLVESCSEYPDFFFITHITNDDSPDNMTIRPVEALAVHDTLIYYGMSDPLSTKWLIKKSIGVMEAGESLFGKSENPPKHVAPRLSPRPMNIKTGEIDWDYYDREYKHTDEFMRIMNLELKKGTSESS